jgi:FtsH-binding integral membrane protein
MNSEDNTATLTKDQRTDNRAAPRRLAWYALAGLLLTLTGPVLFYLFFLDQPFLRSTGLPAVVLMLVGLAVGVWAIRGDRRLRIRVLGGLNLLLAGLFVVGFCYGMVLPAGSPPVVGETAPDFTLADQTDKEVTLSEALSTGPVLLMFYRGYW